MSPTRLSAYTLHELMVVMLLSSLVIAGVYAALRTVSGYYHHYQQQQEVKAQGLQLPVLLEHDLRQARMVYAAPQRWEMVFSQASVIYTFTSQGILRQQGVRTDTFSLVVTQAEAYWQQTRYAGDQSAPVDELLLVAKLPERPVRWQFRKTYDARTRMILEEKYDSLWPDSD